MRLTSLSDYAVLLMRAAAQHCGCARANAGSLSLETGIPAPTTQKLVNLLSRAGLLKAIRGSGGGVKLARPAAAISLADIVEAVEGPVALTSCLDPRHGDCALETRCAIQPHWRGVNALVRAALDDVSLTSLLSPLPVAVAAPVPTAPRSASAGAQS